MKIQAAVAMAYLVFLASCQPLAKGNLTESRLAAMEDAIHSMARMQKLQEAMIKRLVVRQRNLDHGIARLSRKQKIDKEWIAAMRQAQQEDAGRIGELSFVVGKMIDPLQKMNLTISRLRIKIHQLRQQQGELIRLMPGATKPLAAKEQSKKPFLETPSQPVDKKKRRKVLESVA